MNIEKFIYILSIALQISGGLLLVIQVFKNRVTYVKDNRTNSCLVVDNIDNIKIPEIKDRIYILYISRIGFIYVFIGYVTSIFGDNIYNKIIQTSLILIIFTIISLIGIGISKWLANKNYLKVEDEYKNDIPSGTFLIQTEDDD